MDMDIVIVLLATVICHASVAYVTVAWIFRKKSRELAEFAKPDKLLPLLQPVIAHYSQPEILVPQLVKILKYRPQPDEDGNEQASFIEEFTTYMGTQLGRYLSGMLGRANRGVENSVLDAVAQRVPLVGTLVKVPGFKKWLNHPLVGPLLGPMLEKEAAKFLNPEAPPPGASP